MASMGELRVLSIQSHVVSGYVGNKSAVFPLQILGYEVDSINSVQFSNHTGYDLFCGQVLNDNELIELYHGLASNKINHYSHLLTGYVASDSFLRSIAQIVSDIRKVNPHLKYVCDPVLGDDGEMYVPESLIPIYIKEIVPLSDVITPNQYEAELLTGIHIIDLETAKKAINQLHSMGPATVVLTSCCVDISCLAEGSNGDSAAANKKIISLASKIIDDKQVCFGIEVPHMEAKFTGSGDLFAALFLAWNSHHPNDLKLTLETVCSTMQSVLKKTLDTYLLKTPESKTRPPTARDIELKLVQSKKEIESPRIAFTAFTVL